MNENTMRKIAYNCRKATFLIEKKQVDSITAREKLELKIHLAGCAVCRTFEQQSIMINKMVHDLFHEPKLNEFKLDDNFKREMQDRIKEKIHEK